MNKHEVVNDLKFDEKKEKYCPQCYWDDDELILREDCKHNKKNE